MPGCKRTTTCCVRTSWLAAAWSQPAKEEAVDYLADGRPDAVHTRTMLWQNRTRCRFAVSPT